MIPAWLAIAGVALFVAIAFNRLFPSDIRWFSRQRRPHWLTFEWAIPWIWISIFICGAWSAYGTWQNQSNVIQARWLMVGYVLLEVLILSYTPLMTKFRSLILGTVVGAVGFVWGAILASWVFFVNPLSAGLLLPYLLWSPVGTWVTWQMSRLNS
jgi:tryptophan-rich sensory protein